MECYCCLRNIQDFLSDGKTPCERQFGEPFKGPIVPFGSMVEYHLLLPKTRKSYQECSSVRYHTRGGIWKGNILAADIGELEKMDASEIHARKLNAKEVLTPRKC